MQLKFFQKLRSHYARSLETLNKIREMRRLEGRGRQSTQQGPRLPSARSSVPQTSSRQAQGIIYIFGL